MPQPADNVRVTHLRPRRRVVFAAAIGLAAVALVGCSNGPSSVAAQRVSAQSPGSPAASTGAVLDLAAVAAARQAVTVTTGLRSYAFHTTQQLTGGASAQTTTLIGHATRPGAVSYALTVGGQTQPVINVAGRTYRRPPGGVWKALTNPSSTVDPVASLLPLLTGLTQPTLTGRTLRGTVPAAALRAAGLAPAGTTSPASAASTAVTFTLNASGQVTALTVQITVKAGEKTLTVRQTTTFSAFNAAPAITAPSTVAVK